jgi:hypothetical protein
MGINAEGLILVFFSNGVLKAINLEDVVKKDARSIVKDDLDGIDVLILLAGISNDPFGHLLAEQIYDPTRDYALSIALMCNRDGTQIHLPL